MRTLQRLTLARVAQLDQWLDALLAEHGLTNRELILVGFSKGRSSPQCAAHAEVCEASLLSAVLGQPSDREADDHVAVGGWTGSS